MLKANNNATYEIGIMFRLFSILQLENHRPLRGNNRELHPFVYAYTVARTLVKSTASMIKRIGVMSTKLSHVIVILSPYQDHTNKSTLNVQFEPGLTQGLCICTAIGVSGSGSRWVEIMKEVTLCWGLEQIPEAFVQNLMIKKILVSWETVAPLMS